MLVLGRKINDTIVLDGKDGKIFIKITRGKFADTNNLRVAIEAPKDVKIIRGELYEGIDEFEEKWSKALKD